MNEELKPDHKPKPSEAIGPHGREPELLQDACGGLSQALSSKPDARLHARKAAAAISAGEVGWIEWSGFGDRPTGQVVVRFRYGAISTGDASWYNWHHKQDLSDITAYRIVQKWKA